MYSIFNLNPVIPMNDYGILAGYKPIGLQFGSVYIKTPEFDRYQEALEAIEYRRYEQDMWRAADEEAQRQLHEVYR